MKVLIDKILTGSGQQYLLPSYVYVLREDPFDSDTSIGEELQGERGSIYGFDVDLEKKYQLWSGGNLDTLEENTDFGIKLGRDIFMQSPKLSLVAEKSEDNKFAGSVMNGLNSKFGFPTDAKRTFDMNANGAPIDLNSEVNFDFNL